MSLSERELPIPTAGEVRIRPAEPRDAEACGRIMHAAFGYIAAAHGFPTDFPSLDGAIGLAGALIADPSVRAVVAERGRVVLGSNFLSEGDPIRGVGPISVDPRAQRQGAGRLLMEAVLRLGQDAHGIRLVQDAFNTASMALYASLGFEVQEPLLLVQGTPRGAHEGVGRMQEEDLDGADTLCRRLYGIPRLHDLRGAVRRRAAVALRRDGRVAGYLTAPDLWLLNHGVAETESDMAALLAGAAALTGAPIGLLLPSRQAALLRHCLAEGMRVVKPMTLMATGAYQRPSGCWFPSVFY